MTRRLEDYARRRRRRSKRHERTPTGRVTRLFADQGYGFIETPAGDEVYFHENSVAGTPFEELEPGDRVRFVPGQPRADEGPQASAVTRLTRRRSGGRSQPR